MLLEIKTTHQVSPALAMCSNRIAQTDSMCSSNAVYTQEACQDYLLTLQGCLPNRQSSSDVYISATDQVETEGQVNLLLNSLRYYWSVQALSVELLLSHSCVCTHLGYVTAVEWPMGLLSRSACSLAQMYVHLSGLEQTASSSRLDCHLCQSVHPSQVLPQISVVSLQLLVGCFSLLTYETLLHEMHKQHTHTYTHYKNGFSSFGTF